MLRQGGVNTGCFMLERISLFYVVSPLFVFISTWFNAATSVMLFVSCFLAVWFINFKQDTIVSPDRKTIIMAISVAGIWCFWSGIGGWVFQTGDFEMRNAIYNDLITKPWPVYYGFGLSSLVYYFGYWLIPALVTHILDQMFNFEDVFRVGLNVLLAYSVIGVTLFLLLLVSYIRPVNGRQLVVVLLFPLFFSGMDIIGAIINHVEIVENPLEVYESLKYQAMHLEIYSGIQKIQNNCMTTQLFWVFNQAVPSWIIMMLLLKEKDNPGIYGVLLVCAIFLCPFPAVGMCVFMLFFGMEHICKKNIRLHDKVLSFLSNSNIFIVPTAVFVVLFLSLHDGEVFGFVPVQIGDYALFCLLEFYCYAYLVSGLYWCHTGFWAMLACLFMFILFGFEKGHSDFQMRTTIPALLVLMVFVLKYLLSEKGSILIKAVLSFLLLLGTVTPLVEFSRGALALITSKQLYHTMLNWGNTLEGRSIKEGFYSNYKIAVPYHENFYRTFVKKGGSYGM